MGSDGKWIFVLWVFSVACSGSTRAFTVDNELKLKNMLLKNDGISTVRPNQVTLIELAFNLLSINTVDIKNELFGVSGWWSMTWMDSRLNWTNSSYTAIPVVQVTNTDVWTPALVVDNSVENLKAIQESTIPLRLRQDGEVTWNPPGILVTSCDMVVTYFPFDIQTCSIQVTSFGYTLQELNISVRASGVYRTYYQKNGEWTILKTWNERSEFQEDDYTYAKVSYYIQLQRRTTYYGLNTMLPVLLNSLLIPLVFLLPHDSGEKIGYCLTVLLAYVVILTLVTGGLPTTAKDQSLLGVFIAIVLALSGISVFLAIHSLHIYHRTPDRPIPSWQASLTSTGLRILRLECIRKKPQSMSPALTISPAVNKVIGKRNKVEQQQLSLHYGKNDQTSSSKVPTDTTSVLSDTEGDQEKMSWQLMARVYDAFLLRLYFAIIFIASVSFLLAIASNQF